MGDKGFNQVGVLVIVRILDMDDGLVGISLGIKMNGNNAFLYFLIIGKPGTTVEVRSGSGPCLFS